MTEVIMQVDEEENKNSAQITHQHQKKMHFIRNLCQYMIMLVKDFEVVASFENDHKVEALNSDLDLVEFTDEIQEIIVALINKKSRNNKIDFQTILDPNVSIISTDDVRLKQILINLLSNSVKFTDMGSIILTIDKLTKNINMRNSEKNLGTEESDAIMLFDNKENNFNQNLKNETMEKTFVRFSINDSGKGLSGELIDTINEEKVTGKIQKDTSAINKLGTGYGLSIVQKLCKVLNSKLYAKKNTPSGSIFYFDILQDSILSKKKEISQLEKIEQEFSIGDSKVIISSELGPLERNESIKPPMIIHNKPKIEFESFHKNDKLIFDNYEKNIEKSQLNEDMDKSVSHTSTIRKNFSTIKVPRNFFESTVNIKELLIEKPIELEEITLKKEEEQIEDEQKEEKEQKEDEQKEKKNLEKEKETLEKDNNSEKENLIKEIKYTESNINEGIFTLTLIRIITTKRSESEK